MPVLLIDGFNIIFRSFYGMPELTRSDGLPTNAVHGWVRTMWKLLDEVKPEATFAYFDLGGSVRRLELDSEYKANRDETPELLKPQIPWIKQITHAMGIAVIESEGIEADDILASNAVRIVESGREALIVSADKDFAQCLRPGITQFLPPPTANPKVGWRRMDVAGVKEKFGVSPDQITSYLALVGDTSDNIPGLKGVGPKTASKWINEYGTLNDIIAAADEINPSRFREKLAEQAERLRLNLDLVTFELDIKHDETEPPIQLKELVGLFEELEMNRTADEAVKRYNQPPLL